MEIYFDYLFKYESITIMTAAQVHNKINSKENKEENIRIHKEVNNVSSTVGQPLLFQMYYGPNDM